MIVLAILTCLKNKLTFLIKIQDHFNLKKNKPKICELNPQKYHHCIVCSSNNGKLPCT